MNQEKMLELLCLRELLITTRRKFQTNCLLEKEVNILEEMYNNSLEEFKNYKLQSVKNS